VIRELGSPSSTATSHENAEKPPYPLYLVHKTTSPSPVGPLLWTTVLFFVSRHPYEITRVERYLYDIDPIGGALTAGCR
jgi:hypothetical protein